MYVMKSTAPRFDVKPNCPPLGNCFGGGGVGYSSMVAVAAFSGDG